MIENLWQEYMEMPPVTRAYTTACFLTTSAIQLDLVTPFHLYFNPRLIFIQLQLWRLITSFCFFGTFGFSFLFNMIFTYRYCRMLEEGSFRNQTADFVLMFIFGATIMVLMASFVTMVFLGQAFTIMIVYVWSRRNPFIRMNFFGLLTFNAPYLPWVLLAFSLLLGNSAVVDFMGIACGHLYFFLEDVFPAQSGGFHILKTPNFLKWLFNSPPAQLNYDPLPEDQRPGGYNFGGGGAAAGQAGDAVVNNNNNARTDTQLSRDNTLTNDRQQNPDADSNNNRSASPTVGDEQRQDRNRGDQEGAHRF